MAVEAAYYACPEEVQLVTEAAVVATEVNQLPDGRAGVYAGLASAAANDPVAYQTEGIYTVAKTTGMVFLPGDEVWWDHSANKAHYKKVNDRDFFLGSAYGDAASADATMKVNLNVAPVYNIDLLRDGGISVPTGTQAVGAFGFPKPMGGARLLELTATNEAQCIDILSRDRVAVGANPIMDAILVIPANGSTNAVDFTLGIASATSTTDADAIAESIFFHMDGNDLSLFCECDDGTNETAATDSTIDATAGTAVSNRVYLKIDARDISNVKFYINGSRVLSGTTFTVAAAAGPWGLLAHLEKSSSTATGQYIIEKCGMRTSQQ